MTKSSRTQSFSPEEDMQIVRLRAQRYTFKEISAKLALRSQRSIETRMMRLEKNGEAAAIRRTLLESGAVTHGL